jgi:formyltetrahydrofolate synthetase
MAILCLSKDVQDLRRRIENIILGFTYDNKPFTVKDLGVAGAITVLLKEALHPNLVQTTRTPQPLCTVARLPTLHTDVTRCLPRKWP